ncbi:Phosphoribosyl pyrophosphokinase [Venustampulla echinocandica]|uniref:Ribose-phosphate pyrophosphokinase 1 n=1 Tax=Venustampulla echinocandica TaxID=2656787 RepID=A0A370TBR6_9HELO|nr:Phosphoribosyl pyrophosphokinase [Venustampulla echinocandica]RDL31485.1 Phosphoribosyl pyrophosphokinase [Venustampulla echinocandica]
MAPAAVQLSQFANGETSVTVQTSVREKDVFVVQSGSSTINDSIMELLILINACKGGSANKITAVLPYFPYSRQSKKKAHRGAITARMLANLLHIAGVNHVITIDLHASQMQGFFKCPVDNLHAEPIIARWIRHNVPGWQEAVCVSKNPGGTKRVTSLADALKLNFGMVTTDKRRGGNMSSSMIMRRLDGFAEAEQYPAVSKPQTGSEHQPTQLDPKPQSSDLKTEENVEQYLEDETAPSLANDSRQDNPTSPRKHTILHPSFRTTSGSSVPNRSPSTRAEHMPVRSSPIEEEPEFTDERARDITHGRLVQGHIVPDDYHSPPQSAVSPSMPMENPDEDPMVISRTSSFFNSESRPHGPSADAAESSDEEEEGFNNSSFEHMITLVGDVRNRTVFIVDDMIDKAGSWIAAAECVVKRGGAKKVYCIATHGLFGADSLEELENCECIDAIVVTNSFPIVPDKARAATKLVVLPLANLLAEAIRRNHYGESISALFTHTFD